MNQSTDNPKTASRSQLNSLLTRVLPIVDELADRLGVLLLASLVIIMWIFVYLHYLQNFSLVISASLVAICALPWLILLRIWFALENVKQLPENMKELADDVSESAGESFQTLKSGKRGFLNIIGQTRKLFQLRTLLNSGSELVGDYFSIGPLINPIYLILAVLSLICLFLLMMTGSFLAILSVI
ncbi:MAG: hypothetical protein K0U68_00605 [Gammaproteobacteria bacterium]|nr:hypothetical protein [Gammaproteobacteria bacterium]